jgi:ERCC4-related helicase/uncharacterized membrane protein YgcG
VQSAAEIDRGEFDAPQHFKTMLMYQEIYLCHLAQHADQIAQLESRMLLLQEREAKFLDAPPAEEAERLLAERVQKRAEGLRTKIRGMLQLREYQKEAVDLSLKGNRIINLPTGTGKTIIAVKLLDYFLHHHPQKNVIFVVPTRALVEQQAKYVKDHSHVASCTVAQLYGMEMDKWDEAKWALCTKSNRVLVGTAEIFRQALVDRGFLNVAQISLCIFDECHHAVGNAPMANIMRDALYSRHVASSAPPPRIVGLTASFVSGKCDNLISKRHDLEALLHASLWAPDPEHLQKPDLAYERIDDWLPPSNGKFLEQWTCESVGEYLEPLAAALAPIKKCDKVARHAAHVLLELGMRALIYYLEIGVFHELEAKVADLLKGSGLLPPGAVAKLEAFQEEQLPRIRDSMRASAQRLKDEAARDVPEFELSGVQPETHKARRLLALLADINSKGSKKGILFVKQTALLYPLAHLCRQDRLRLRVAEVGGGSSMTDKDRNKALADFRRGTVTLLVATDAAEEGIDVADCEFVIRFNWFGTTKSHIQGSGRARKAGSTCYYFENDVGAEQRAAARLNNVARDENLALSDTARTAHHDSYDGHFATRTPRYPYHPPGEAVVNLSNAGKILRDYCAAVLRQEVAPTELCTFREEVVREAPLQLRRTLLRVRFPTPEGWRWVAKDERDADLTELFDACGTEIERHPRYLKVNNQQRDVLCFFYVVVVQLRREGLLDAMNRPSARARNGAALACEAVPKDRSFSLKPKFRNVPQGGDDCQLADAGLGARGGGGRLAPASGGGRGGGGGAEGGVPGEVYLLSTFPLEGEGGDGFESCERGEDGEREGGEGGDDDAVVEHGVQDYLSVIKSAAMDSKKTDLITAMLRREMRPHVLKVFSETAMWRGQGETGYFHSAPEDWNLVAAALGSEALSVLEKDEEVGGDSGGRGGNASVGRRGESAGGRSDGGAGRRGQDDMHGNGGAGGGGDKGDGEIMRGTLLSEDGVDDLEWVVVEESEDMEEFTESGGGASAQTPIWQRSPAFSPPNGLSRVQPASTGVQRPLHVPSGAASEENVAAAAAAATSPPASALQALKTQADRRGLQLRCEDERVSEQEWRARIVFTTSAGHATELPWSGVCLGLKRAKQAAAELALDCMLPQQVYTPGGGGGSGGGGGGGGGAGSPAPGRSALQDFSTVLDRQHGRFQREEQRAHPPAVSSPNGLPHSPPASTGVQRPLHVPTGAAGEGNVAAAAAAAAAAATSPPASALQALKTQADRRGLQLRCEDERVSEQEWRARIVFTTSAGHATELPWSGVCLGLKRAKQAAAELALDCMPQQPQAASTPRAGVPPRALLCKT